jgi:hypothetical protein
MCRERGVATRYATEHVQPVTGGGWVGGYSLACNQGVLAAWSSVNMGS